MKTDLGPIQHRLARDANIQSRTEAKALKSVEDALARLEAGNFGLCTRCNQPIAMQLLCANPTIQECETCSHAPAG